jgi:flagellar hook assembly protein FlgD
VANVTIFNASGVQIRRLASNELLATEGFFIWDGTTDTGQNANVGIYVLFFEKFHVGNGKRKQAKLPLVVSAR